MLVYFCWGMAATYLCAFASLLVQIDPLYGPTGVQPLSNYLQAAADYFGNTRWLTAPTILYFFPDAMAMKILCVIGMTAALCFAAGLFPPLTAFIAWASYLSCVHAGAQFLSFQWDILLLESGFLLVWLYPFKRHRAQPRGLVVLLIWWLLFRLMFASGAVKLLSQDPLWRDWSAMFVHFETTPLPGPLNWYAHQLPDFILRSLTGLTFFVELFVPWLIFLGDRWRKIAAGLFVALMIGIATTGNYTFFNLLSVVLALTLLRDSKPQPVAEHQNAPVATAVAFFLLALSSVPISKVLPVDPPDVIKGIYQTTSRYFLVGSYGLFANMTDKRPEIEFQLTDDNQTWHTIHLRYKPGRLDRRPAQVAPHQPRADWQLWFAALGPPQRNRWVFNLLQQMCQKNAAVYALFETPAPGINPVAVRARRTIYQFTDLDTRRATDRFWQRSSDSAYGPTIRCSENP